MFPKFALIGNKKIFDFRLIGNNEKIVFPIRRNILYNICTVKWYRKSFTLKRFFYFANVGDFYYSRVRTVNDQIYKTSTHDFPLGWLSLSQDFSKKFT